MALYKIQDFYPNYREEMFEGDDIKGYDVYANIGQEDKIGTVEDALVDESGYFRYLVIDTGFWIFGKKVLMPIGRCRVDTDRHRVYAIGIENKEQIEQLPDYHHDMEIDRPYEERVRSVFQLPAVEHSAAVEATPPVEASGVKTEAHHTHVTPPKSRENLPATEGVKEEREVTAYEREPDLYQVNERDHQQLKLYEERLIANKNRAKAGEVTVGKRVEKETAKATVPVEKEKVIVEVKDVEGKERRVAPGEPDFGNSEVARMEVYEENADIRKEAFVRGEVEVRKEVERDRVEAEETIRREELEVNREGSPVVEENNPS